MASRTRELRELDDDELVQRLAESQEELFNLRFQNVTGKLDNHARLGQLRRDVARLNTVLREREIAAAEALAGGSDEAAAVTGEDEKKGRSS